AAGRAAPPPAAARRAASDAGASPAARGDGAASARDAARNGAADPTANPVSAADGQGAGRGLLPGPRDPFRTLMIVLRRAGRHVTTAGLRGRTPLIALGMVVGLVTGYAVVGFRLAIEALQTLAYGATDAQIHSQAAALPWYLVLPVPVVGGLAVGLLLWRFTPDGKARGVADVIRAAAMRRGRIDRGPGLASAGAALITLSTGGSTGREGPAVHIGAVIASWVSEKMALAPISARDVLGCAAAAAVSASFNAPLAGALFALEVVLRHFALHAFGPIVVASVMATVVSRLHFGNVTEFELPPNIIGFYSELPAFVLLGALAGIVAAVMMRAIFVAERVGDWVQARSRMPNWARPAAAGLALGIIALAFPHIIGVGYETTTLALTSEIPFWTAVVYAMIKVVAVAITMAGRMGGGVFSPALMMGALLGTAFGSVAIALVPSVEGSQGLYALAGMGAVAAAVLGAPISSTLIIIEFTGDWQAGMAVLVSVALASVVSDRLIGRSFFLLQLRGQGLFLDAGPQGYLASTKTVDAVMRQRGSLGVPAEATLRKAAEDGPILRPGDTLQTALQRLEQAGQDFVPVVDRPPARGEPSPLLGAVLKADAYEAYNKLLVAELREEHS
ncbi:MAG: chloride channel protein, partial [Pseudomonadota bacterium]